MVANPQFFKTGWISEENYLQGELVSDIKRQYIEGYVYAMSGASRNHERIAGNIFGEIRNHLKGKPCEAFSSDLKIKAGLHFFYPDAMVVCDDPQPHAYYTESPVLVVEVVSKSTRKLDETTKRRVYQSIPSLQEYVLIEQDIVDVEVCRRSEGWQPNHFFMGDDLTLESIGLTFNVNDIYLRVENEDVRSYWQDQQTVQS